MDLLLQLKQQHGDTVVDTLPPGPEVIVKVGDKVQTDQALNNKSKCWWVWSR